MDARLRILDTDMLSLAQRADPVDELKKFKIRTGTLDLRIAAIVLERNAILVTCNRQDFAKIPNLDIEDWSIQAENAQ